MKGQRTGVVVTPRTPRPTTQWMEQHRLGWVRSIFYDFESFDTLYAEVPTTGTYIFGLINGENPQMANDFWSDGWEDRWRNLVETYCINYSGKVRAIEFLNEWGFWQNANRAEVAAKCAIMGTRICRTYGILGFLGSLADADWVNQFNQAMALIQAEEDALGDGTKVIDGVIIHPYGANSGGVPTYWATSISDAVRQMRELAPGRLVAITEAGIKLIDIGLDLDLQAQYVHNMFVDPGGETYQFTPQELLCSCYFAWCDHAGNENEQGDNAFGLIDFDGNPRPALASFEAVCDAAPEEDLPQVGDEPEDPPIDPPPPEDPPVDPPPPEPTPPGGFVTATEALEKIWKMHRPNASFRPTWGIEKAWMQNYSAWGSVWESDEEVPIEYAGASYNGRIFVNAVVIWKDGAAVVLHDTGIPE